ncbi:NAD(P)/FAD-dependent oxidoreductase [uncultured Flavobacterium sp.]|uniref:flavin monoamine oxidase family protein n=1 Tax=uncultured Flavobacterium sp. TaxID=165435 RepID=UPI0025E3DA12|nr:NAD(P)/FAD-dependent oxidoreductase [uncultured Flavobacterium sp.]
MEKSDIIIIGAGASGLMAGHVLANAGKRITVLEARGRIGGRIHTLAGNGFSMPVELGAEFVHGNLPITLGLLEKAGIGSSDVGFEMWHHHAGKFAQSDEFVEGWDAFLHKLNQLGEDMPILDFMEQEFPGEQFRIMRQQISDYISGYDTADVSDAGAFALRREWNHEDEDAQHRVEGGYRALVNFLADTVRHAGNSIHLNNVLQEVVWKSGCVRAITTGGKIYEADKIIIALPLGVLRLIAGEQGGVKFSPPIDRAGLAFRDIGFGSVIKIVMQFNTIFWEDDALGANLSSMGFLFSDETVPTYWTQSPAHSPLLTGWLGGPAAKAVEGSPKDVILTMALGSLANIFSMKEEQLRCRLVAWHVADWTADPFTLGSYAYDKVETPLARKFLSQPMEGTIFFAGEYLYDGPAIGTVEAALTSGRDTANELLGTEP